LRKNKVFFAGMFGFVVFYSYILIREQDLAGGETGWVVNYRKMMFSAGRETGK
jgi:hypothetical protein